MYKLLECSDLLETVQKPDGIQYEYLMKPHELFGEYQFLHGVHPIEYHGRLFVFWARNEGKENSITEFTEYRYKTKEGWFPPLDKPAIRMPVEENYGHSHGVPFVHQEKLYYMRPRIQGLGDYLYTSKGVRMIRFLGLCSQLLMWHEENDSWETLDVLIPDILPTGQPKRTAEGNYVIGGVDGTFHAVVAMGKGDDIKSWYVRCLRNNNEAYAETDVLVKGNTVLALMRNEAVGILPTPDEAPVAISKDGGRTFRYEWSNLPMSSSKPGCGRLSDGRPFFLFSYEPGAKRGRRKLYLGIGESDSMSMSKVYLLDDGTDERWLAYPYGVEISGHLYVGYSSTSIGVKNWHGNPNDAMLAVIPLASL